MLGDDDEMNVFLMSDKGKNPVSASNHSVPLVAIFIVLVSIGLVACAVFVLACIRIQNARDARADRREKLLRQGAGKQYRRL